jgi:hypothetical protein
VTDLSRRVEFGVSLFHLIGTFARLKKQPNVQWALSLIGCPGDAKYAITLLLKVHTHNGLRAPLAALIIIALPPHFLDSHLQETSLQAISKRLAVVETHIRTRIPDSPFLYWCASTEIYRCELHLFHRLLACSSSADRTAQVVTLRLELAKKAWRLCQNFKQQAVMLGVSLCYVTLAQCHWSEIVEHATLLVHAPAGTRQWRFSLQVLHSAALAALETLEPNPRVSAKMPTDVIDAAIDAELLSANEELKDAETERSAATKAAALPVVPPASSPDSRTRPTLVRAFTAWISSSDMVIEEAQDKATTEVVNKSKPHLERAHTDVGAGTKAVEHCNSKAMQLLTDVTLRLAPTEDEDLLSRRVKAYLVKVREVNCLRAPHGLWLLPPEMAYIVRRGDAIMEQVKHAEMLRLLDEGARQLMKDLRAHVRPTATTDRRGSTQACMFIDLVEGLIDHGPNLLSNEVMRFPEKDFELYYEVPIRAAECVGSLLTAMYTQVSMEGTSLKLRFKPDTRTSPVAHSRSASYAMGVAISSISQSQSSAGSSETERSALGHFGDTMCLWLLLRGLALRDMSCFKEAAIMFRLVTSFQKTLVTVSTFVGPAALFHHAETVLAHPERDEDVASCAMGLLTRARNEGRALGAFEYDSFYMSNIQQLLNEALRNMVHTGGARAV